ncbi:glycosyltransferase family 2 protein [Paenibacillus sedimenti]|uniref:Glycosyltransferase family 2 protein n=1 Tax=Paenibacillus sedimenti TaxID=2770274 RepID=A0A926KP62_9BACL|nr:glycosyltransferase family 2 protein [Paenibacillus sedimenti]MBD0379709.1 glycosyltransferase family 2 protein [Paenibacillus sedimenti]
MKTVSVHIVTYNSVNYLDECLQAVADQDYPIKQVIVVDNASTDGTVDKLTRWLYFCDVVGNSVNNGFAGGHNQAIQLSEADYCLILNPDVTLQPGYVRTLITAMDDDHAIGSSTGKLLFKSNQSLVDSTGLVINKARRAFDRGANEPSRTYQQAGEVFGISGAAAMYARKMIDDISVKGEFFDEDFFAYKEDVDVAWRAQLMGWKAYFEPAAIAYHERGWKEGGRSSKPLFVRRLSYINRYKMIFKNDRFLYAIKHIIPLLIYEVLSFAYALIREPKLLVAWASFFRNLSDLVEKRRIIQSKKRTNLYEVYKWYK